MVSITFTHIPAHDGKNMAMFYPMYGKPQPQKCTYQIFKNGSKVIGGVGPAKHAIKEFNKRLL